MVSAVRANPTTGLRPVAILSEQGRPSETNPDLLSGTYAHAEDFAEMGIRHAVLCLPRADSGQIAAIVDRHFYLFPVVFVCFGVQAGAMRNLDLAGLGNVPLLRIENRLLLWGPLLLKRIVDLLVSYALALLLAVPAAVIAVLVSLDSPGPILFRQTRVGKGGRVFRIFKFRTMVAGAEDELQAQLRSRPDLVAEWKQTRKLRADPRITRIGRFLRKTSLDELPQLLNVLRGEMSLVGPRPIIREEILKYGAHYNLYVRVRPGVTGLWQVSGRSRTTYPERVALDGHYVRNWNLWLDLLILSRTAREVLTRNGAY
jgi:Undecaprenyl-phosphate galactose phosphotransferase WbaP